MSTEQRYDAILLAEFLRSQGRKQRWLADRLGIHESLVSEWVHGRRTIGESRAKQIARVLEVPFGQIFSDANASEDDTTVERVAS